MITIIKLIIIILAFAIFVYTASLAFQGELEWFRVMKDVAMVEEMLRLKFNL